MGFNYKLSTIIASAGLFLFIFLHAIPVFAAGTLLLSITLGPGYSGPFSVGEEIQYRISFSCNSLQESCGDLLITSAIDPNLEVISLEVPVGFNGNIAGQDISITRPDYQDGSAAEALVTVRVRESASPDVDITTTVNGTISEPTGGTGDVTTSLDIDIEPSSFLWEIQKSMVAPEGSNPALDANVTYEVQVSPETLIGNLDADTLTVVDTYPEGAIVVNATGSPAPTIDTVNHTITWVYNNVTVASGGFLEQVTLRYPSTEFSLGQTVLNSVSSTGLPVSAVAEQFIGIDGNNAPLSADVREVQITKSQTGTPLGAGGIGRFFLALDLGVTNVPLDNVIVGDTMPVDGSGTPVFDIVQIQSGIWEPTVTAEIYICCDSGSNEGLLATVDGSTDIIFTEADFPAGFTADNITSVEWRYTDPVPVGYLLRAAPEIVFTPKTGYAGQDFTNLGYTDASNTNSGTPDTSDVDTDILENSTNVLPQKIVITTSAPPNGIIQFRALLNINEASNQPLDGLAIFDNLPPELEFVSWDNIIFSSGIPLGERVLPNLLVTPNGNRTELLWIWSNTVPAGAVQLDGSPGVPNPLLITEPDFGNNTIEIVFSTRVVPNTPAGTYNNSMTFVSNVGTFICQGTGGSGNDNSDIDGDGITGGDTTCSANSGFTVTQAAALISSEWIQGDSDYPNIDPNDPTFTDCPDDGTNTRFTRFPCVAQGEFGGPFFYKMRIQNAGNVPITDYITYNILPYVGDTGSGQPLVASARQSAWLAFITGPITANNGFTQGLDITIEYSDSIDPCRPEVSSANNTNPWQGACVNDWTTTPDNFRDVRAFRIISPFGTGNGDPFFQPAQMMEFLIPMRINPDADPETIAWNSFAQRARDALSGDLLETSEPRKVGILARRQTDDDDDDIVDVPPANSPNRGNSSNLSDSRVIGDSDVSKQVRPFIAGAGDQVTWSITLTNPGTTPQAPVGFDDSIPSNLIILSANAPIGTVTINGQVVEYRLDSLAPGQSVTVEIVTRIDPGIPVPFIIENSLNQNISATVINVSQLPNTGETPYWRNSIIFGFVLVIMGSGLLISLRMHTKRKRS